MTHSRKRIASYRLEHALKWSPAVGILGMRQVGKTTLMKTFSKSYFSFDDPTTVIDFERNGRHLLESTPASIGLDEVQKAPIVFDLVKLIADESKRMGNFILTGSVRFSSKKQIRESLTGRIALIELFPLTLSECYSQPSSRFLDCLNSVKVTEKKHLDKILSTLEKRAWATNGQIENYLNAGGLPGICFRRDARVRDELFKNHLDALLGRDLDFVLRTKLTGVQLNELFALVAQNQGLPINYSALAREIGITSPTAKSILRAFEALFLIRAHGQTYFIEDQGLASYATSFAPVMRRKQLTGYLYHELRCQAAYGLKFQVRLTEIINRGGVFLPFLLQLKGGSEIAITFDSDSMPSDKSLKSLTWYRKKCPKALAVAVHLGKTGFVNSSGTLCVPITWVV